MAGQLPVTIQGYQDEFTTLTFPINSSTIAVSSSVPLYYAERDTVIDSVILLVGTGVSSLTFDVTVGAGATPANTGTTILTGTIAANNGGVIVGVIKTSPANTPNNIVNGPITTPVTLGQVIQLRTPTATALGAFNGCLQIRIRTRVA